MKKNFRNFLITFMMVLCMFFGACSGCNNPTPTGYNYDEVVTSDYDYIASQYPEFCFYEADVLFDNTLDSGGSQVVYIRTVFQVNDTCIMIYHNSDKTTDTTMVNDYWMECMPMGIDNPVSFDSCMIIIDPYRDSLNTRNMTFRRVLGPQSPKNGQYIFGKGILVVDAVTGKIEDWEVDTVKESGLKSGIDDE